jgi:hypothetical protein
MVVDRSYAIIYIFSMLSFFLLLKVSKLFKYLTLSFSPYHHLTSYSQTY